MSSKFCKNQLYCTVHTFQVCFLTKLYTIFYYLHYFLLFSKFTYYFVWRNLPTNSNYFRQKYTLFLVTLVIINANVLLFLMNNFFYFIEKMAKTTIKFLTIKFKKPTCFNQMNFNCVIEKTFRYLKYVSYKNITIQISS